MKRLTYRDRTVERNGVRPAHPVRDYAGAPCGIRCPDGVGVKCDGCWFDEILERLAAYEDTGVEPEEITKCFNEDTMMKLAAQYLGVTPNRLRTLVEADGKIWTKDLYDEDGGEILKGECHEATDNK